MFRGVPSASFAETAGNSRGIIVLWPRLLTRGIAVTPFSLPYWTTSARKSPSKRKGRWVSRRHCPSRGEYHRRFFSVLSSGWPGTGTIMNSVGQFS